MSKVTELLAKHSVESAELEAALEQLLTTAESKSTDGIPKGRFNEVIRERNELKADVEELNAKITGLETKISDSKVKLTEAKAIKDELDSFKNKAFNESKSVWLDKSKLFDVAEDDKKYPDIQKIKSDFIFKEKPEDYTEEDIAQNLNMLKPYEKIGYFGDNYTPPDIDDKRSQGGGDKTKVADPLDMLPE